MMITIHGFPAKTKYQDVKILLKQECNINDFILDNLMNDTDGTKKVRIGLADNTEGFKVMKCLDGYRMSGNFILKAVPIGKTAPSQPQQDSSFDSRTSYQNQSRNDYSNTPRNEYMSQAPNDYNSQGSHGPGAPSPHGGIHGSVGPRPSQGGPHGEPHASSGPQGSMDNRPSPWVSGGGNNSNQWNAPMANQVPQNSFGFTSPQANVNPSYGQQPHQSHPRPGFNQGRASEQSYGYTPKNVPEVVPANSRFRWVKNAEPEPKVAQSGEDSPNPSSIENNDENSQDLVDYVDKQDPTEQGETTNTLDPSADNKDPTEQDETSNTLDSSADNQESTEQGEASNTLDPSVDKKDPSTQGETTDTLDPDEEKRKKKSRKREINRLRDISKLNGSKRRRLYFWLKQGKTFMEARELCEIRLNRIPEYPAAKAEKKIKAREIALRRMSPERKAREMKMDKLIGRTPGARHPVRNPGEHIRVRIQNEVERMSQEQIEMIQDKILELVDAETEGNGPNFVGCSRRGGCLSISCANAQTLEWLEKHLPDFQLWEGADLKLINLNLLPKPVIGIAFVADPDLDDETILRMLKSQNQGIDFSDWWITNKKPDLSGQTVTFNINKLSAEKLAERNNFVYLGLKKTKIRIKTKAEPEQGTIPPKKQLGKGKMNMPPNSSMGQKTKGPKGKMGIPPNLPKWQMGYGPKGKMSMPPKRQRGMAPMDEMGMGPMNSMGMGPMDMGPMGPMGMGPMNSMRMGPMNPMGMGPMGPMDMGPMGPMDMGPMGPMGMGPMGPMGMGPMGPMGMGPMDPMGMGPMDTMDMGQMDGYPRGSSYASGYSQPKRFRGGNQPNYYGGGNQPNYYGGGNQSKYYGGGNQSKYYGGGNQSKYFGGGNQSKYFGGGNQSKKFGGGYEPNNKFGKGNQSKHFGGGKKPQKNKNQGGPANDSGPANEGAPANNGEPNPEQGNSSKKSSNSKARRNKERMQAYLESQGKGKNQQKKSWKKPKNGPPN